MKKEIKTMLITCPECNKTISDKAKMCPNCGYPLAENKSTICIINDVEYDLQDILDILPKVGNKDTDVHPFYIVGMIREKTSLTPQASKRLADIILETSSIPAEYNGTIDIYKINATNLPKCPKCGSTSITTGARGVNFTWGLIGASKTVNRCANCGYTWKPSR